MVIYIDIDQTICRSPLIDGQYDYNLSKPIVENITKANKLYDDGHEIVYWTARGSGTGLNWEELTNKQFKEWGVKFHDLKFGKPVYDLFIDDKNINTEDWSEDLVND
tara:strand:- start:355 stop:675 length:321 start_codon:yes stop_codon:yes gene_type:complete